jgi:hypothetical protein
MPWEQFSYTRQQVHDAVWSAPMRDACKQFGISDVALAKICRKLDVPRPRQGYWLRVSLGQQPPRRPLPPLKPGQLDVHEGKRWHEPPRDPTLPSPTNPPQPATEAERIEVPEKLSHLHPVMKAGLAGAKKRGGGAPWSSEVPIKASAASADRALRIMNALMLALETRGHRVEAIPVSKPGERWRPAATGAHVGDAFVEFSMFERSKMIRNGPPPEKRVGESTDETWRRFNWRRAGYVPNGTLTIRVGGQDWDDKKSVKLEARLHEVVAAVCAEAEAIKRRQEEHRKWEEEQAAQRILEAEARRRREHEEALQYDLRSRVDDWAQAQAIRGFLKAVEEHARDCAIASDSKVGEWTAWARERAKQLELDAVHSILKVRPKPQERAFSAWDVPNYSGRWR